MEVSDDLEVLINIRRDELAGLELETVLKFEMRIFLRNTAVILSSINNFNVTQEPALHKR